MWGNHNHSKGLGNADPSMYVYIYIHIYMAGSVLFGDIPPSSNFGCAQLIGFGTGF